MDIIKTLAKELNLKEQQVQNTVALLDEGNTIPFIARYRKEATGSLDDQLVRELSERLAYLRGLEEKREQIRKLIAEQEKLTDEISLALDNAQTITALDDIYRPFRPKRRTRATIAKERGLEGLATFIWMQNTKQPVTVEAERYVDPEKEVNTVEDAIEGAKDILAEVISDDADYRGIIRKLTFDKGFITSKVAKAEEHSVYEMYFDFSEPVKKIAGHRVLALNRGEKEGVLSVGIEPPYEEIINKLNSSIIRGCKYTDDILTAVIEDSYKRLIAPSVEREIRNEITDNAQEGAIKVFGANLKQLLLQAPIKDKVVLALDPGYRTGCKIAVVDGIGKVLETGVIYPLPMHKKVEQAKNTVKKLIDKYGVDIIAVGNGTASRETEQFTVDVIKEVDRDVCYIIVNEAGASVYSASKLGAAEFPDLDVAVRSAVSLARRLQDALSELVKIDPKSIGVGQYQHDMNQKRLGEALGGVVEDCVNSVGVDLNTASPSLLEYVSGVSGAVAKNIIAYREENGRFTDRKQLLKVSKLGPKAFEQCAGFLRISDGDKLLDNTGVHPESYPIAEKLLASLDMTLEDIKNGVSVKDKVKNINKTAQELECGVPTLKDIINELEKPGRDPRDEMPKPVLRSDVLSMEDLTEGMILKGTVRNVIDFGAFVDIGVHQDGLVHISEMTDRYIKHPLEAVSVGDVIDVKVIGIDLDKHRISLSMKC
jgi:uncharacterized protein